jgi:hypothetical protein
MTIRIVLREKEIVMDRAIFMEILAGRSEYARHDLRFTIENDKDSEFARIDRSHDCKECDDCMNCEFCEDCDYCTNCDSCYWCENCENCKDCDSCLNCSGLSGCIGWVNNEPKD